MLKTEAFDEQGRSRGYYSHQNVVNDLTGKEWVFWTRSVISKVYPLDCQHKLRGEHGGQKPPELCADLIRIFTKRGARVLDPMMGVGGVLLGAARSGRTAVGIDINPRWIEIYREVCRLEGVEEFETRIGDAALLLPGMEGQVFDLVLTDVPYWKMDRAPRSPGRFKRVGESSKPVRPSKLSRFDDGVRGTKEEWLGAMAGILSGAAALLRPAGYLVTFIGDMYSDGRFHCLSAELAAALSAVPDLVWKANIVWYDVSKQLHLYGYQYSYIPSLIHQNILVFRREKSQTPGSDG
jgi:SAM-dependent methyltransferase